jgi:hypothetical protein
MKVCIAIKVMMAVSAFSSFRAGSYSSRCYSGQRVARAIQSIGLMHMSIRRAKPMLELLII